MLIISPKTHSKTVKQFVEFFGAKQSDVKFWHSNFRDYHFVANVDGVPVHLLFCGYGEGTITHAISHAYDKFLRKEDTHPAVIYVGACFATALSGANVGELIIPNQSHSDSEIVRDVKTLAGTDSEDFDPSLTGILHSIAKNLHVKASSGKIFCKETYDDKHWFSFARDWGTEKGYIAGEVESAACLAACNALKIPCAAILEIKDKLDEKNVYYMAEEAERFKAFANMLDVLKGAVPKIGRI